MSRYAILDVDNANRAGSICSFRLRVMRGEEVLREVDQLIDPQTEFDPLLLSMHGVTPQMVDGSPRFGEFWRGADIGRIFADNIVVGHNTRVALRKVAHSLSLAGITMPPVKHLDTLHLARRFCRGAKSCRLPDLAEFTGVEVQPNDPMGRLEITHRLFEHIMRQYLPLEAMPPIVYRATSLTEKKGEEEVVGPDIQIAKEVEEVRAILERVCATGKVTTRQKSSLRKWTERNIYFQNDLHLETLLGLLLDALSTKECQPADLHLALEELEAMPPLSSYAPQTRALQIANAILKSIPADGVVPDYGIERIGGWLDASRALPPSELSYAELLPPMQEILEAGRIEDEQRELLLARVDYLLHPDREGPAIPLTGRKICLAGAFLFGERRAVADRLLCLGATVVGSVSRVTDLLIVGAKDSESYKFSFAGGGKVEKARELKARGSRIKIISELAISDQLKGR